MNKLIAVVGMCGSGKSIATNILEKKGWYKIYLGGITYQLMKEAGIERTPTSEKEFRESLRKQNGLDYYVKLKLPEIKEASKTKNVVIDGLYSWEEYKYLKENLDNELKLICTITDKNIRYDRISKRPERPFNLIQAEERDLTELENLHKGNPVAYADYFIFNNGTLEDYETRLEEILKQI